MDIDPTKALQAAVRIGMEEAQAQAKEEIEKLRAALQTVLDACDQGWKVERSVGGITVEGQMRRSFYNRVPAWPIEEVRAALGEKE